MSDRESVRKREEWRRGASRDLVAEQCPTLPAWLDVRHPTEALPPRNWSLRDEEDVVLAAEAYPSIEKPAKEDEPVFVGELDGEATTTIMVATLAANVHRIEVAMEHVETALKEMPASISYATIGYQACLARVVDVVGLRTLRQELSNVGMDEATRRSLEFNHLIAMYTKAGSTESSTQLRQYLFDFLESESADLSNGRNTARLVQNLCDAAATYGEISMAECKTLVHLVIKGTHAESECLEDLGIMVGQALSLIGGACKDAATSTGLTLTTSFMQHVLAVGLRNDAMPQLDIYLAFLHHTLDLPHPASNIEMVQMLSKHIAAELVEAQPGELATVARELLVRSAEFLFSNYTFQGGKPDYIRLAKFLSTFKTSESAQLWAETAISGALEVIRQSPGSSPDPENLKYLTCFLTAIRQCKWPWSKEYDSSFWESIFEELAVVVRPSNIAPALGKFPGHVVPRIVARYWLKVAPLASIRLQEQDIESLKAMTAVRRIDKIAAISPLLSDLSTLYTDILTSITNSAAHVIEEALQHFLEITLAMRQPHIFDKIVTFAKQGAQIPFTIKHRPLFESYIKVYALQRPQAALRLFKFDRRLLLSRVPALPLDLATSPHRHNVTPKTIVDLLGYSDSGATVPFEERKSHEACSLTPERIMLAHELALVFADAERFSSSAAWRHVLYIHDFLCTHHAPMGPMMSKAAVIAGVIRSMRENKDVALEKFRFVLRLVRRIDGHEAADELDKAYWMYRKQWLEERRRVDGDEASVVRYERAFKVMPAETEQYDHPSQWLLDDSDMGFHEDD